MKDKKTSAYFVEDVRRCPVIEEGAEDMDIEDNGGLPYWNGQRAKEIIKTEQRELEKGKDSQRALVAEEWDAINQVNAIIEKSSRSSCPCRVHSCHLSW